MDDRDVADVELPSDSLERNDDNYEADDSDDWKKEYLEYMSDSSTYDPRTGRYTGIVFRSPENAHRD